MHGRTTAVLVTSTPIGCTTVPAPVPDADPALELHRATIVIDTHSDATPWFQDPEYAFDERHSEGIRSPAAFSAPIHRPWLPYIRSTDLHGRLARAPCQRHVSAPRMSPNL